MRLPRWFWKLVWWGLYPGQWRLKGFEFRAYSREDRSLVTFHITHAPRSGYWCAVVTEGEHRGQWAIIAPYTLNALVALGEIRVDRDECARRGWRVEKDRHWYHLRAERQRGPSGIDGIHLYNLHADDWCKEGHNR